MNNAPEDYPHFAAQRGRIEPVPRRVRGSHGNQLVFDTTAARYVWELPYYPQFYIPLADVVEGRLRDDEHPQRAQFGPSRIFSVVTGCGTATAAARVFDVGDSAVAGLVRFEWEALAWFEEDEPIYGHPRNPYARVDALRSHRHVTVTLDGVTLADSRSPVLVFETGLPTRYYIDRTDIAFQHLERTGTQTLCPYKGITSRYWSARVGDAVHADLAWTYEAPLPAVAPIANLVAFFNEKVDITVDGVRLARAQTHFG